MNFFNPWKPCTGMRQNAKNKRKKKKEKELTREASSQTVDKVLGFLPRIFLY